MFTDSSSLSFLFLYFLAGCTLDTDGLMQKERVEVNKGERREKRQNAK
jgi:hypothetical protein